MKKEPIAKKLYRTYALWFIICIFVIMCMAIWYMVAGINETIADTQDQMKKNIDKNVENYFVNMNEFSLQLVTSDNFKNLAIKEIPDNYKRGRANGALFSALSREANQMIANNYKLGIVTNDGCYIWIGDTYNIGDIRDSDIHTYDEYARDGIVMIKRLERNEYLLNTIGTRYSEDYEESVLTLSRSMGTHNFFSNGQSILEVQISMNDFENEMKKLMQNENNTGLKISIFDSEGNPILLESDLDLGEFINSENIPVVQFKKDGYFVSVDPVFHSNIYVVYTISIYSYYNKLAIFLIVASVFCLLMIFVIMYVTYKISRQISRPIHIICLELQAVDLEKGVRYQAVDSDIYELDFLSHSVAETNKKLEDTLNQIIMLKDLEVQSKMLALQAQMQPHFLFNTLATIGSMAEQHGYHEITNMCSSLTKMFRYIAAEEAQGVLLFEEIKHVSCYVDIMRERFPNATVDIDIPMELMHVKIPKLTIQPLVENSFKYCNRSKPYIQIHGQILDNGYWSITVCDNGDGFSAEKIDEIMQKCERSIDGIKSLSAQIDNMGLVNVYVRLKLFYHGESIYSISPRKACITIGGNGYDGLSQSIY